eukprot:748324-Hanusia_phi.AAC.1
MQETTEEEEFYAEEGNGRGETWGRRKRVRRRRRGMKSSRNYCKSSMSSIPFTLMFATFSSLTQSLFSSNEQVCLHDWIASVNDMSKKNTNFVGGGGRKSIDRRKNWLTTWKKKQEKKKLKEEGRPNLHCLSVFVCLPLSVSLRSASAGLENCGLKIVLHKKAKQLLKEFRKSIKKAKMFEVVQSGGCLLSIDMRTDEESREEDQRTNRD